ncbi:hypothetical protein [Streptomyces sp. TLI_171]|uniref:hypothetical protein n=1 Tax=Streptomyces sp. TLI_171 TaxID=1938859 RepID=UPI000C651641|nr:hypothetical protein [Streptomyces sp. TLI_171]RKE18048.1 hypothetical protein BX266_1319 [Streptomyces sp. TLI_171]
MRGIRVPMMTAVAGAAAAAVLAAGCGSPGGSGSATAGGSASAAGSATARAGAVTASPAAAGAGDNGVAALGADEIVQKSVQALKDAKSVRAVGTVTEMGQRISLDLRLDTAGNCRGILGLGGDGSFEVVKAGHDLWVKPDRAFWQSHGGSGLADLVGDRYLKTTADDPDFGDLGGLCDLGALADQLGAPKGTLAKGDPSTVQGRAAVSVTGSSSSGTGTLYVAASGAPVPLRLEKDNGAVDFSDFGTPVPSGTPGPDQSVDLNDLLPSDASSVV